MQASVCVHLEGGAALLELTAPGVEAQPHHLTWTDPDCTGKGMKSLLLKRLWHMPHNFFQRIWYTVWTLFFVGFIVCGKKTTFQALVPSHQSPDFPKASGLTQGNMFSVTEKPALHKSTKRWCKSTSSESVQHMLHYVCAFHHQNNLSTEFLCPAEVTIAPLKEDNTKRKGEVKCWKTFLTKALLHPSPARNTTGDKPKRKRNPEHPWAEDPPWDCFLWGKGFLVCHMDGKLWKRTGTSIGQTVNLNDHIKPSKTLRSSSHAHLLVVPSYPTKTAEG
ncbi:uncharacterized protein GJ701_001900 isoform 1-T1 [Geothlypis trichas]